MRLRPESYETLVIEDRVNADEAKEQTSDIADTEIYPVPVVEVETLG